MSGSPRFVNDVDKNVGDDGDDDDEDSSRLSNESISRADEDVKEGVRHHKIKTESLEDDDIEDDSDDGSDRRNSAKYSTNVHYEQLGAPVLLYRNVASYTVHDEELYMYADGPYSRLSSVHWKRKKRLFSHEKDDKNDNQTNRSVSLAGNSFKRLRAVATSVNDFVEATTSLNRCFARWYYPMDYTNIRPTLRDLPKEFLDPSTNKAYFRKYNVGRNKVEETLENGRNVLANDADDNGIDLTLEHVQEILPKDVDDNGIEETLEHGQDILANDANDNRIEEKEAAVNLDHDEEKHYENHTNTSMDQVDAGSDNQHDEQSQDLLADSQDDSYLEHNGTVQDIQSQDLLHVSQSPNADFEKNLTQNQSSSRTNQQFNEVNEFISDINPIMPVDGVAMVVSQSSVVQPSFHLHQSQLQEKRARMLHDTAIKLNDLVFEYDSRKWKNAKYVLKDHQIYDSNYYAPALSRSHMKYLRRTLATETNVSASTTRSTLDNDVVSYRSGNSKYACEWKRETELAILAGRIDLISMFERDRINRSDPSYLAPFGSISDLILVTSEDNNSSINSKKKYLGQENSSAFSIDHINSPTKYGNCILVVPCGCFRCMSCYKSGTGSQCILHPIGPLMDIVKLSFLCLPMQHNLQQRKHEENQGDYPIQLDIGDRLRQLVRCGGNDDEPMNGASNMYVARTDSHCTIFQIGFDLQSKSGIALDDNVDSTRTKCSNTAELVQLYRIDVRQPSVIACSIPSYVPIDVACHPRYGNREMNQQAMWCDANIVIAYESSTTKDRNILHHFSVNEHSACVTGKHIIRNLQFISCLNFSSHHPMVLWSASRSYVRPTLTSNTLTRYPRFGHGTSLYSIDLRTNEGTFQWSPSHEEFLPENIHSVSGIQTDWDKDHTVWVSSISAGKSWELDTRMPCQVVSTWSLPHAACDDCGSNLPPTGMYGAGTLFLKPPKPIYHSRPLDSADGKAQTTAERNAIMLSIGKSPDTYGIHMYYRPLSGPKFQTTSVEGTAHSLVLENFGSKCRSLSSSSILPLPDVSPDVFTCGIASFRSPSHRFLEDRTDSWYPSVNEFLTVITMTNHGDLYSHTVTESTMGNKKGKSFYGLPVGSSVVQVPENRVLQEVRSPNILPISLSNEFPLPSRVIRGGHIPSDAGMKLKHAHWPYRNFLSSAGLEEDEDSMEPFTECFGTTTASFASSQTEIGAMTDLKLRKSCQVDPDTEIGATLDSYCAAKQSVIELRRNVLHAAKSRSDVTQDVIANAWKDNFSATSYESEGTSSS